MVGSQNKSFASVLEHLRVPWTFIDQLSPPGVTSEAVLFFNRNKIILPIPPGPGRGF